jgi:hypothetical protein
LNPAQADGQPSPGAEEIVVTVERVLATNPGRADQSLGSETVTPANACISCEARSQFLPLALGPAVPGGRVAMLE